MSRVLLAIIAFLIGVGVIWVIGHFEPVPWMMGGSNVSFSNGTIKLENNGQTTVVGQELSPGFPKTVPIYQPSAIVSSSQTGSHTYSVSYVSQNKPADIYNFYLKQLPANGWTIVSQTNQDGSYKIDAKGHGSFFALSLSSFTPIGRTSRYTVQVAS